MSHPSLPIVIPDEPQTEVPDDAVRPYGLPSAPRQCPYSLHHTYNPTVLSEIVLIDRYFYYRFLPFRSIRRNTMAISIPS